MLNVFNDNDDKLQFTHKIEIDNKISFLDVLTIKNDNDYLETDRFTKPTFSGRFLNYDSQHPSHRKIAMVYNLVDRAVKLSCQKFHKSNI